MDRFRARRADPFDHQRDLTVMPGSAQSLDPHDDGRQMERCRGTDAGKGVGQGFDTVEIRRCGERQRKLVCERRRFGSDAACGVGDPSAPIVVPDLFEPGCKSLQIRWAGPPEQAGQIRRRGPARPAGQHFEQAGHRARAMTVAGQSNFLARTLPIEQRPRLVLSDLDAFLTVRQPHVGRDTAIHDPEEPEGFGDRLAVGT
ncbi:hypothetical protein [Methylobacterium sp. B4]|uniref:hypothetical protein n=1 Tax=Methylobacterium sp. B4 TaxID=1938755 RepID=UPI001AEC8CA2|nr:hypothetical protein [Methylobacterium sp. B4]